MGRVTRWGGHTLRWRATHRVFEKDDSWAEVNAKADCGNYRVSLTGPQAQRVVEKVAALLSPTRLRMVRTKPIRRQKRARKPYQEVQFIPAPPQQRRPRSVAVVSIRTLPMRAQFPEHELTWGQAVALASRVFSGLEVFDGRTWDIAPEKIVPFELQASLCSSGYRRASVGRRGFHLVFAVVKIHEVRCAKGKIVRIWDESVRLKLYCPKDNEHPLYRRMRNQLGHTCLGKHPTTLDKVA